MLDRVAQMLIIHHRDTVACHTSSLLVSLVEGQAVEMKRGTHVVTHVLPLVKSDRAGIWIHERRIHLGQTPDADECSGGRPSIVVGGGPPCA